MGLRLRLRMYPNGETPVDVGYGISAGYTRRTVGEKGARTEAWEFSIADDGTAVDGMHMCPAQLPGLRVMLVIDPHHAWSGIAGDSGRLLGAVNVTSLVVAWPGAL